MPAAVRGGDASGGGGGWDGGGPKDEGGTRPAMVLCSHGMASVAPQVRTRAGRVRASERVCRARRSGLSNPIARGEGRGTR